MSALDQRAHDLFQSLPTEQKMKALAIMRSLVEAQERAKRFSAARAGRAQDKAS